ncbi:MAG TPA: c-type cytochrome [Solirubrobacterales bacterium]|nr:c-type cytochrome [Solirubrobacterales bacterium]
MPEYVRMLTSASPRSFGGRVAVALGLLLAAVLLVAGSSEAPAGAQVSADDRESGAALYASGCQSCHGVSGEGVSGVGPRIGSGATQGAGPPLLDVTPGTVHFYLSTGYMPLDDPRDVPKRSAPAYDPEEIEALVAYVASLGADRQPAEKLPTVDPESGSLSEGQEIFTESCAGCHQVVAEGGVIGEGVAPELRAATDQQIAEAVRAGPYLMPRFSEHQIDDDELDSLVAYVNYTQDPRDEGGWGIGHIGPIPEGLAAWLVAAIALVGVARLIGRRTGKEDS